VTVRRLVRGMAELMHHRLRPNYPRLFSPLPQHFRSVIHGDMIHFHEVDMMVRGGSIALLALWTVLLLRDHRHALPARLAVAMNIAVVCHVLATIPGPVSGGMVVNFVIELGSIAVPALFWLFTRSWFNDEKRIGWRSWLMIPVSMTLLFILIQNEEQKNFLFYASGIAMRIVTFSLAIAGLWVAWKGRDDDLIEDRRRLRVQLIGAVGTYVLLTNGVEVLVFNGLAPELWRSLLPVGILALTLALCAAMFGLRRLDLLGPALRPADINVSGQNTEDPLAPRLLAYMDTERPYRDETITIAKLAGQLGEPEYRLRRLINGQLGFRNFATFLNGYRLAEVKSALADPEQRQVPILTIALDAGFGSLGPFNRAFREAEQMTPTEFRNRAN
jgi:AraC-like DNA-binding protein